MTIPVQQKTHSVVLQDLSHASWTLERPSTGETWPAAVPGSVHTDLLRAEAIPDPFYRENETTLGWIGESDWRYAACFDLSDDAARRACHLLRFHGLDTLADVTLNGHTVLQADNMHRTWEVDVTDVIQPRGNQLVVTFRSPIQEISRRQSERPLPGWYDMMCVDGPGWLRKQLSNFGWDWGPALVTAGIWRAVELLAHDGLRLQHVDVAQTHEPDGTVRLTALAEVSGLPSDELRVRVTITDPTGRVVAEQVGAQRDPELVVPDAQLWFPRGLGEQPLYFVTVDLLAGDGAVVDTCTQRIGLRTLRLAREADAHGESFAFECNGVRFFAKGANWIPADAVVGRATPADIRASVEDAAAAHMNMLRVWGGGLYEEDAFYDACDELGICVWQDVAFACATFPGDDPEFLESVAAEVADNARRLRHHPSLALWCGNNELEMGLVGDGWTSWHMAWDDYLPLMDEVLPSVVATQDPGRDYWPASPHTPGSNRKDADDPTRGDAHLWKVWHGGQHPNWYRTSQHRFVSEFGFQSFPHPATVESFTEPADRDLASPVMDLHQKAMAAGANGSAELARQLVQFFRTPATWDGFVWQTQMLQATAVVTGIEHWRRNMPVTMGTLYWQLNDCWPGPSWSSVDSEGRWKALHYAVRRAYAPVMLSLLESPATGQVTVHLSNDNVAAQAAEVTWAITSCDGEPIASGVMRADVPGQTSVTVGTIEAAEVIGQRGARDVLVWAELVGDDQQTALATFAPPKHLSLRDPQLRVDVHGDDITVTAQRPALWVWLDSADPRARPSDNFFHMPAGKRVLRGADPSSVVRSLVDTLAVKPTL